MSSPQRKRNPKGSGEQLRGDLVAAAIKLLAEHGDDAKVTLRGVAAAVGVAPTAVYLHFADREELMVAVIENRFAAFDEAMKSAGPLNGTITGSSAAHDLLKRRGLAYIRFALSQPGAYRLLFLRRPQMRADLAQRIAVAGTPSYFDLLALGRLCHDHGFIGGSAEAAAAQIWSFVHGYADLAIMGGGDWLPPAEIAVETFADSLRQSR